LAEPLEAAGIGLIHDTTQHDYPSYNGSYERSARTVEARLEEKPSLRILLDLHRDAMPREDDVIVKPVRLINGKKAAQIMIIAGCDDGEMNMPNWPKNLRFAVALQNKIEEKYPGLMRPIYLCYRKYNMHLSDGSLLLEFGSNASTLEEAEYAAQLAGEALAELILEHQEQGEN
jgi:stage II sporulation protein P